jgi:hypothetical protein
MYALEALRDHGPDAQQQNALAAQSREDPDPYSLPATISSGTPSCWYFIAS